MALWRDPLPRYTPSDREIQRILDAAEGRGRAEPRAGRRAIGGIAAVVAVIALASAGGRLLLRDRGDLQAAPGSAAMEAEAPGAQGLVQGAFDAAAAGFAQGGVLAVSEVLLGEAAAQIAVPDEASGVAIVLLWEGELSREGAAVFLIGEQRVDAMDARGEAVDCEGLTESALRGLIALQK